MQNCALSHIVTATSCLVISLQTVFMLCPVASGAVQWLTSDVLVCNMVCHFCLFLSILPIGIVLMMQVAQAGSQGDKKARRVLSLRAHHLKETLLKAKTDLKAHKATARQQAYKIGLLSCILQFVLLSMPFHGLCFTESA